MIHNDNVEFPWYETLNKRGIHTCAHNNIGGLLKTVRNAANNYDFKLTLLRSASILREAILEDASSARNSRSKY